MNELLTVITLIWFYTFSVGQGFWLHIDMDIVAKLFSSKAGLPTQRYFGEKLD